MQNFGYAHKQGLEGNTCAGSGRAIWLSGTADGALVYPCIPVPCHPEAVSDIVDELTVGGAVGYHHQRQHRDFWSCFFLPAAQAVVAVTEDRCDKQA